MFATEKYNYIIITRGFKTSSCDCHLDYTLFQFCNNANIIQKFYEEFQKHNILINFDIVNGNNLHNNFDNIIPYVKYKKKYIDFSHGHAYCCGIFINII